MSSPLWRYRFLKSSGVHRLIRNTFIPGLLNRKRACSDLGRARQKHAVPSRPSRTAPTWTPFIPVTTGTVCLARTIRLPVAFRPKLALTLRFCFAHRPDGTMTGFTVCTITHYDALDCP